MKRAILRTIGRCWPLYSGMGRFVDTSVCRRAARGLPEQVVVRLRSGAAMKVRPADRIGRSVYFTGELDPKITWICRRLLRPGDCMVDIGGNCGLVTMNAATMVGAEGQVHTFEPQPDLAQMIRESTAISGFGQVTVHAVALSDSDGVAQLHVPDGRSGAASLEGGSKKPGRAIEVKLVKGDAYLEALDLPPIRLMKVDVEGHEAGVFRGMAQYLTRWPAAAILFESNESGVPFLQREPVRILRELGYRMLEVPRCLLTMHVRAIGEDQSPEHVGHDIVALHESQYDALAAKLRAR